VNGTVQGALLRRVVREHRRSLVILSALLVLNVAVYAVIVYPLGQRVANIEARDRTAEDALASARADYAEASGTLTGKDRAATELATFYMDVLPTDLAGARRLTHLRLPQLARQSGLRYERSQYEAVEERGSTLKRLKIEMILSGSYGDMRTFIYQLETAPEFVVIENVSLSEEDENTASVVVTLQLSTYYVDAAR
jgi:Tfp pilus assembly protein PilO